MAVSDGQGRERRFGLPPVVGNAPTVLILGTIPSVLSSRKGQYYGNPLNHFWRLMGEALEETMPDDYRARCETLTRNGIAVWDVLAECDIRGSGDHSIANPVPNDILGFLEGNRSIRHVFINGKAAHRFYLKFLEDAFAGQVTVLPSSSPANAMRWADRREKWVEIGKVLRS